MRIGIGLITPWIRTSIDFDGYMVALRSRGAEGMMLCTRNFAGDAEFPVMENAVEAMESTDFWLAQKLDVLVLFSWLRRSSIVRAAGNAGTKVILRGDTDGIVSVRVFPAETFRRSFRITEGGGSALRRLADWLDRYWCRYRFEDAEYVRAMAAANAVVVESEQARHNITRFLDFHGQGDLAAKCVVVPHSVSDLFLTGHVDGGRLPRIFCGGRWDDDQKDAVLLAETIKGVARRHPEVTFAIAGRGGAEAFHSLAEELPQVRILGALKKAEMPALLRSARFLLSSSRWESQPIGSLEALCSGCTIVAPPLPSFQDIVMHGQFGTLSRSRSARSLCDAVTAELGAWEERRRDPGQIARHWRGRVSNARVIGELLDIASRS